jgi:hypothetical protein
MGDSLLNQPKLQTSYAKAVIARAQENNTLSSLGEDSLLMMLPTDPRAGFGV